MGLIQQRSIGPAPPYLPKSGDTKVTRGGSRGEKQTGWYSVEGHGRDNCWARALSGGKWKRLGGRALCGLGGAEADGRPGQNRNLTRALWMGMGETEDVHGLCGVAVGRGGGAVSGSCRL